MVRPTVFKQGNPGRPKGVQDMRTRYYDVLSKLKEMGHDPVEALIILAQDESEDSKLRLKANCELMARIAPVLKAIEHKGDTDANKEIAELKQEMHAQLEKYRRDH